MGKEKLLAELKTRKNENLVGNKFMIVGSGRSYASGSKTDHCNR